MTAPAKTAKDRALADGRQLRWQSALLMAVLATFPVSLQAAAAPVRVAVLGIELLKADYFPDSHVVSESERHRLDMVAETIRTRLLAEGYEVVTADATEAAVRQANPLQRLHACNGCERDIARSLSADWVLVGWVQLVSNLILNLNVVVVEVETGAPIARAFVDLRSNTERSWRHATNYLLDHVLIERLATRR